MNTTTVASLLMMASLPVVAETITFDQDAIGSLPNGWMAGVTGRGTPKWTIEADPTAPTAPNVLKQSGAGTFPWCVKKQTALTDGVVEVKFKPISGSDDAAGGVVWRWKDGDNYYVARANGIEVTALHSHMLTEQPRVFFMHFWANDDAMKLAKGIRAALDKTAVAKS